MNTQNNTDPWELLKEVVEELSNKRQFEGNTPWPILRAAQNVLTVNLLYNNHGLMNRIDAALADNDVAVSKQRTHDVESCCCVDCCYLRAVNEEHEKTKDKVRELKKILARIGNEALHYGSKP
jgi:hypothetical protein